MITMYSKENCVWCDRARELMTTKEEPFTEVKIGRDITREEFMEQFPNVRSVPYFTIGEVVFPSFDALKEYIENPVRVKMSTL